METIIIQAESKKAKALKQFLKAFGIDFKVEQSVQKEDDESPYDPEFVKKIVKARNEKGGKVIDPSNLWGSLK